MNNNVITVGIDLGTDKCCITYQDNIGRPFIITDEKNYKISSVIAILNNGLLVGNEISKNFIYDVPIISNLKRLIGHKSNDIDAINIAKFHGWELEDNNNDLIICVNKNKYTLFELLSLLLSKIKQIITNNIGENFNTIITIPANFNEGQKNFILSLCKHVNINCKRLIFEPCSAALAYINYFDQTFVNNNTDDENIMKHIMVFDFGAGTLDLSIVTCNCNIDNGQIEWQSTIESYVGNNNLGGIDIDIALEKYINNKFPKFKEHLIKNNETVRFIIEKIKIKLSHLYDEHKSLSVSLIEKYYNQTIVISLQDYFNMLDELFKDRIIKLLNEIHKEKIEKTDIDNILLIGGSCYNPWVRNLLCTYYKKEIKNYKLNISDHFETYNLDIKDIGVSLGATCIDKKHNKNGNMLVLTESLPLSIGIDTINNIMCKILPKNTPIPFTSTQYFSTSEDNQTKIEIKLYQGECDDVRDNFFIGSFVIDNIPPEPLGKPVIILNISVSTDGLITVEGKLKNTENFNKKIIINRYETKVDENNIESNIKKYELNDSVFNYIMKKYYELITMLNKLQYNLIDNIMCSNEKEKIDEILKLFWDDLVLLFKLMSQSEKIKSNIAQLEKFIGYIGEKMKYNINCNYVDCVDDNVIASKIDILNKFIEKNLQHLVSSFQIKTDGFTKNEAEKKYDVLEDNIKLNQINSIANSTEILNTSEKTLIYQIENNINTNTLKSNIVYLKEIKDLSIMIINEIDSFSMSDENKLLTLSIFEIYDTYIDKIINNNFDGKKQLEIIQNICMKISNINDNEYIENLQNEITNINIEKREDLIKFENILTKLSDLK